MASTSFVYLDHAAATPMSETVHDAMLPYFTEQFYNPSATYLPARNVKVALDVARQKVAETIGARASEIVFTAGGTEANNLAISGIMSQYPEAELVTLGIEHDSVLATAEQFAHTLVAVEPDGIVDAGKLIAHVTDKTVLVSVMYVNNEVGTVQPIRDIAMQIEAIRKTRKKAGNTLPLYLHTDAAQAANYFDLHVARLGVDLMTLNGGKIYGPKQSGVLYVRGGVRLQPLVRGGGQESGLRSGTENVGASIGFAVALEEAQKLRHEETARLQSLQKHFYRSVLLKVAGAKVNGSTHRRSPNNVHITIPGIDNERVLLQLEQAGILAAAGSACSASSEKPSHVLAAMGLSEAEAQSSLRFTMGRTTTEEDIDTTVEALTRIIG
jgi:cysteine desulfurase